MAVLTFRTELSTEWRELAQGDIFDVVVVLYGSGTIHICISDLTPTQDETDFVVLGSEIDQFRLELPRKFNVHARSTGGAALVCGYKKPLSVN